MLRRMLCAFVARWRSHYGVAQESWTTSDEIIQGWELLVASCELRAVLPNTIPNKTFLYYYALVLLRCRSDV